jgi:hypothetical protein
MTECKKKKFPTKRLALEALKNIRFKKLSNHKEKGIYLCNKCCHWHLTSQHTGVSGLKIITSMGIKVV